MPKVTFCAAVSELVSIRLTTLLPLAPAVTTVLAVVVSAGRILTSPFLGVCTRMALFAVVMG